MSIRNKIVLLTLALITISAKQFVALPQEIRVHEKSNKSVRFSEIYKSARFVKLETSPDCLIAGISAIKIDDGKIFIFDRRQYKVLIFNIDGSFVSTVGTKGKGPGEMVGPTDITLDRENKFIEILDAPSYKTLVFDYDGNYITTNESFYASVFEKLSKNAYLAYSYNYFLIADEKVLDTDLAIFDNKGKVIKEFEGIRNVPQGVNAVMSNFTLDNNGNAYLIPILETSLYRINKDNNITRLGDIVFDTKLPKNPFKNVSNIKEAFQELVSQKCPGMITGLTVVDDMLSFTFYSQGKTFYSFVNLYDNSSITVQKESFTNDLTLLEPFGYSNTFDDGVIAIYQAVNIKEQYSDILKDDPEMDVIESQEMKDRISEIVKKTETDDNPILIFYTYK